MSEFYRLKRSSLALLCLIMMLNNTDLAAQSPAGFPLYLGPERPAAQIAVLSEMSPVFVQAINGCTERWADQYLVLPGRHSVTAFHPGFETIVLYFEALAGHSYQVRGYTKGDSWVGTIVDMATMESVSQWPGYTVRQGYVAVHNDDGNIMYVNFENTKIGKPPGYWAAGTVFGNYVQQDKLAGYLGRETTEALIASSHYRSLNAANLILVDGAGKFLVNQHVHLFDKEGSLLGELYVGEGSPIIVMSAQSKLYSILATGEIVALLSLTTSQSARLSGLGQKIAQKFSELGVTKILQSGFFFTQANGGDFFTKLMVKDGSGKKHTVIISEK